MTVGDMVIHLTDREGEVCYGIVVEDNHDNYWFEWFHFDGPQGMSHYYPLKRYSKDGWTIREKLIKKVEE